LLPTWKIYDTIVQYHQKLITLEKECQFWKNLGEQQNDATDNFQLEEEHGFVQRQVALLSNHKDIFCSNAKGDGHFPNEEITDPRVEANFKNKPLENKNDEKACSFAVNELVSQHHNVTSGDISQEETSFSGKTDIRFSEDKKIVLKEMKKSLPHSMMK